MSDGVHSTAAVEGWERQQFRFAARHYHWNLVIASPLRHVLSPHPKHLEREKTGVSPSQDRAATARHLPQKLSSASIRISAVAPPL